MGWGNEMGRYFVTPVIKNTFYPNDILSQGSFCVWDPSMRDIKLHINVSLAEHIARMITDKDTAKQSNCSTFYPF